MDERAGTLEADFVEVLTTRADDGIVVGLQRRAPMSFVSQHQVITKKIDYVRTARGWRGTFRGPCVVSTDAEDLESCRPRSSDGGWRAATVPTVTVPTLLAFPALPAFPAFPALQALQALRD